MKKGWNIILKVNLLQLNLRDFSNNSFSRSKIYPYALENVFNIYILLLFYLFILRLGKRISVSSY